MDRLALAWEAVRRARHVAVSRRPGSQARVALWMIAAFVGLGAGSAVAQVGREAPRTSSRPQVQVSSHATTAPAVDLSGTWHGNLSAPGDSSAAQWAQEFTLTQDAAGNVTGTRKTVALGAAVQFVWSESGTLSGNNLVLNDVAVVSAQGSTNPCKTTQTLSVSTDGSSFNGTWAAPTQSGCQGGTIRATKYGGALTRRLGSGLTCDGGLGEIKGGNGSGGSGGGNADGSSCAEEMGSARLGDPIDASTGNFYLQEDDIAGGEWLSVSRFYNSAPGVAPGTLGFNWRHSYDRSLVLTGQPATAAMLLRPDGKQQTFTKANGVWTGVTPVDVFSEISNAQGVVTGYRVFIGGTRQTEEYALNGKLVRVTGQNGQGVTVTYFTGGDADGLLWKVTDSFGRTLTFNYDGKDRLETIFLPTGRTVSFDYDNASGNLVRVWYPDTYRSYRYDETDHIGAADLPNALTSISGGDGQRFEDITYDDQGRATSSAFGGKVGATKILYNADGSADITYPLGNVVHLGLTMAADQGRVSSLSAQCAPDCGQLWKARTYDANGFPASKTDFNGNVVTTRYNALGLQEQLVEATGTDSERTTSTTWDLSLRLPLNEVVKNHSGEVLKITSWVYDGVGRTLARCEADPAVSSTYTCAATDVAPAGVRRWTYTYCGAVDGTRCPVVGLLLSRTGPRQDVSDTTTYRYYLTAGSTWVAGDLQSITDGVGHVTTFPSYDGAGRIARISDVNGTLTDFRYDGRGRPTARTVHDNADGSSATTDAAWSAVYNSNGLLYYVSDADGSYWNHSYDAAYRITDVATSVGKLHFAYDVGGNQTLAQILTTSGVVTRSTSQRFDTIGRAIGTNDGLGNSTYNASYSDSFDGNGNVVHAATATNEYRRTFDGLDRVTTSKDGIGAADTGSKDRLSTYVYDGLDGLVGVSDADGLMTTYTRSAFSDVLGTRSPDTGSTDVTYNEAGLVTSTRDGKGQLSTFTYDAIGRRLTASLPNAAENVAWYYDEANTVTGCAASFPVGHVTRVVETNVTTTYCYDRRGNVTRKVQTQGASVDVVDYTYTPGDALASVTFNTDTKITYVRDGVGRIASAKLTVRGVTSDLLTQVTYAGLGPVNDYRVGPSAADVALSYDANYRLTDISSTVFNFHQKWDAAGRVAALGAAKGVPTPDETYTYDGANRLNSVKSTSAIIEAYAYSKAGDRLSKTGSGLATGAYSYATGSHLLTQTGTSSRTYDANGATSTLATAGDQWALTYDGLSRLVEARRSGALVGAYHYNAMGQRLWKQAGGVTTRFVYDEQGRLLAEVTGTNTRIYAWMDDRPVATVDNTTTASTVAYIYADDLNAPRSVAGDNAVVRWTWTKHGNPFGEQTPVSKDGYALNLRLPGQYQDSETGFLYNGFRYYDPTTGRYLTADPLGLSEGPSLYQYVDGSPLTDIDPLGLCKNCTVMARVLKGNKNLVGKGGAFNGSPSRLAKYGVTADSAAVIPSQFGLTKDQMRPLIDQISGTLQDGSKFKFNRVRDVVDDAKTRKAHGWHVDEFQENVMNRARAANGGLPTFVLELPGLKKDPGVVQVKLTVPDNVNCPEGTL